MASSLATNLAYAILVILENLANSSRHEFYPKKKLLLSLLILLENWIHSRLFR